MATVTGYTAERMKQIEDTTVVDGSIVGENLILLRRDGVPIDAGQVVGPEGPTGPPGNDGDDGADADLGGYTEPFDDRGNVAGAVVLDFATNNVWRINPTGAVSISFANLPIATLIAPGTLIVANSNFAITWPVGTKFSNGSPPELEGETWLSLVARSTHVTVGTAWPGVA